MTDRNPKRGIARARVEVRLMKVQSCLQELAQDVHMSKDLYAPNLQAKISEDCRQMIDSLKNINKEIRK